MDYSKIYINEINLKSYNVILVENQTGTLPYQGFNETEIRDRLAPAYSKKRSMTPGQITLVLNGVYTSFDTKNRFERDVLQSLNNQPENQLKFDSDIDTDWIVKLRDNITFRVVRQSKNPTTNNPLVIRYEINLEVKRLQKK